MTIQPKREEHITRGATHKSIDLFRLTETNINSIRCGRCARRVRLFSASLDSLVTYQFLANLLHVKILEMHPLEHAKQLEINFECSTDIQFNCGLKEKMQSYCCRNFACLFAKQIENLMDKFGDKTFSVVPANRLCLCQHQMYHCTLCVYALNATYAQNVH